MDVIETFVSILKAAAFIKCSGETIRTRLLKNDITTIKEFTIRYKIHKEVDIIAFSKECIEYGILNKTNIGQW